MKWIKAINPPKDDREKYIRVKLSDGCGSAIGYYEKGKWFNCNSDSEFSELSVNNLEWLDESESQPLTGKELFDAWEDIVRRIWNWKDKGGSWSDLVTEIDKEWKISKGAGDINTD